MVFTLKEPEKNHWTVVSVKFALLPTRASRNKIVWLQDYVKTTHFVYGWNGKTYKTVERSLLHD